MCRFHRIRWKTIDRMNSIVTYGFRPSFPFCETLKWGGAEQNRMAQAVWAHMPQGPYAAGTHRATRRHRERLLCSSNTIVSTTTINIWWLHDDLRVRSSSPLSRSPFARSHLRPSQLSLSASRAPLHLIPWDSLAKYWLAPIRCIRVTLTWRIDFTLLNNTCTYDLF